MINQSKTQIDNAPETTEEITNDSKSEEESNSGIPESDNRSGNEVGDGLDDFRIPFQKIKFGKRIDIDGYGSMFEGEYDNQQVALKQLNITNLGNIKPKLLSEILNIARFQNHPNLVALIGFCDEKNNEITIVYEYISGGNLADNLSKHLTTIQRLEICLGAARGVDYLHSGLNPTPGIIHGDIKLSKILLKLDSISSKFVAKVSSFGLSKLLPGKSQRILDPEGKTKESDVYSFGVILLEVLCGVPELVDTDDYQERHVTQLVPKRLEQNMLRKIVHFDIRNEIKAEALETYAKIACHCVVENPEERPTMAHVVEELEKALILQGGGVTDIEVLGSSNGNGLHDENVDEDDNGETMDLNTGVEESTVIEESVDDDAMEVESFPVDDIPEITHVEDAKNESDGLLVDSESIEETITDVQSNEESNIILENELENKSDIPLISSESNKGDIEKAEKENENTLSTNTIEHESKEEVIIDDKITPMEIENENTLPTNTIEHETKEEEIIDDNITPMEITTEVHNSEENDNIKIKLHGTKKEPEPIIATREINFNDFDTNLIPSTKPQESETKRSSSSSSSTSSESSNGEGNAPSDSLLQKGSPNGNTTKKTSYGSRNCCSCSWWNLISNSLTMLQSCFVRRSILE
ncbi:unnamed protein product [Lactuca virosa]|uniref:Protein kinase domain-containing protein n=1 Tax=Lactuca virosa TaxID=75947 RepID=A0AAU9MEP4_9ASTR|nr:unnamed protein product [Lactuca virosa]